MSIAFQQLAADKRVPGTYVEINPTRAVQGPQLKEYRALLIGSRVTAGTLAQKIKAKVTSPDQVRSLAGPGSWLHGMAIAWFAQPARPLAVEILALDDAGGGAAATLNLTVTASAAGTGTVPLLIAGRAIRVGVAANDSASTIAGNLRSAINAVDGLPVVASGSAATVTLTALNKGTEGNAIDVRVAYFAGEALPTGVTISGTGVLAGGATNPSIDAATLLAIGDVQYDIIVLNYNDTANLAFMATELAARFGPERQLQGQCFLAKRDTFANLSTFGSGQNSPHFVATGFKSRPMPPWEEAAATAAIWGASTQARPTRPVQFYDYAYILPGKDVDEFTVQERELLLRDGIATTVVPAGTVQTERLVTFYQVSPAGAPDTAYLDSETMAAISFIRWDWNRRLKLYFPHHSLANDGTRFGAGENVVTPAVVRGAYAAAYREWEELGIVEDFAGSMRDSLFERSTTDPNRLDMQLAPNIVNGGRVFASVLQFRL